MSGSLHQRRNVRAIRAIRAIRATLAALVLSLGLGGVTSAALSSTSRIGPDGVGPILFGATPTQAAASGLTFTASAAAPGSTCHYLVPRVGLGLRFLVEDGTIRRAELSEPTLETTGGIRVGDAVAKIDARYPSRVRESPDKYDPAARTLTIEPAGPGEAKFRLIFKVRNGRTIAIMAGALPQIFYVEGCS